MFYIFGAIMSTRVVVDDADKVRQMAIVFVPMIAVGVVFYVLINGAESGKSDARVNAQTQVAITKFERRRSFTEILGQIQHQS